MIALVLWPHVGAGAIQLDTFGTVVAALVCLVTIGLGATGLVAQQRNKALVSTMRVELDLSDRKRAEQEKELGRLREANHHLEFRLNDLNEMVTQRAEVAELREVVENGFKSVLARLPAPA